MENRNGAATDFLGYAPVLDSVAVLLAKEGNWHALRERLVTALRTVDSTSPHGHARLLELVVKNVLAREQDEKLVSNIRPVLEATAAAHNWAAWNTLYTPEEQTQRLLGRVLGVSIEYPLQMPTVLRSQYEDRLESWLPEHPFLRDGQTPANAVFESYLYAVGLLASHAKTISAVRARLAEPSYKPSRLFAEFYFLAIGKDGAAPHIPPEHIGWIYDSFLSAESATSFCRLSVDGPEPDEGGKADGTIEADGEFSFHSAAPDEESPLPGSLREFRTRVSASAAVTFSRYIRDATITLPCTIVLGGSASEFEIGPSVYILARELRVDARTLVVGGRTRPRLAGEEEKGQAYDDTVILEAQACVSTLTSRPVTRVPLRVAWPGADSFPWTDFRAAPSLGDESDPRLHDAYRRFRRIVMTLRSHGKGGLARYAKKVEHSRVLKGSLGEALLAKLLRDGILKREESLYHWSPETAARLVGVSWLQLRRGESSPALTSYLRGFVSANVGLFRR